MYKWNLGPSVKRILGVYSNRDVLMHMKYLIYSSFPADYTQISLSL